MRLTPCELFTIATSAEDGACNQLSPWR